jgi:putative restriction endonuclease
MLLSIYVAITDRDWFNFLQGIDDLQEANFWSPGGRPFKAISPGELFLFKLHAPANFIVGGGVFVHDTALPCTLAWETFGRSNGARSLGEMRARAAKYRRSGGSPHEDFIIGCRVLTQPFFLAEQHWIPVPASWSREIVQGKTYSLSDPDGRLLWERVQVQVAGLAAEGEGGQVHQPARYGDPALVRPRLGQGAFRVLVADSYRRRCAVTGERVLPALEAAHIRPYAEGGGHEVPNGLLLRRDIHGLFDRGYVTVTPKLRFEVSRRIKEEFENGRDYYALQGRQVQVPERVIERPDADALRWHNENRYHG